MKRTKETICDKARRLARETDERYRQEVMEKKQAFLDQFELTAHYDDEYRYDLCGYQWTCRRDHGRTVYALRLVEGTTQLPYLTGYYRVVTDLLSLGRLVQQIDEEKAEEVARSIQAITNPKPRPSLWRRFKAFFII